MKYTKELITEFNNKEISEYKCVEELLALVDEKEWKEYKPQLERAKVLELRGFKQIRYLDLDIKTTVSVSETGIVISQYITDTCKEKNRQRHAKLPIISAQEKERKDNRTALKNKVISLVKRSGTFPLTLLVSFIIGTVHNWVVAETYGVGATIAIGAFILMIFIGVGVFVQIFAMLCEEIAQKLR